MHICRPPTISPALAEKSSGDISVFVRPRCFPRPNASMEKARRFLSLFRSCTLPSLPAGCSKRTRALRKRNGWKWRQTLGCRGRGGEGEASVALTLRLGGGGGGGDRRTEWGRRRRKVALQFFFLFLPPSFIGGAGIVPKIKIFVSCHCAKNVCCHSAKSILVFKLSICQKYFPLVSLPKQILNLVILPKTVVPNLPKRCENKPAMLCQ